MFGVDGFLLAWGIWRFISESTRESAKVAISMKQHVSKITFPPGQAMGMVTSRQRERERESERARDSQRPFSQPDF